MNWIYLGLILNVISTIRLIYLHYLDGVSLDIVDLFFISILTFLPFITFSIFIGDTLRSLSSKYKIELDTIIIKGKKK